MRLRCIVANNMQKKLYIAGGNGKIIFYGVKQSVFKIH
ncbi:hypothetical protein PUND_a2829 [Pseudoalteromonas undina]|nr:hypothetical protein PUND_a2829 [Pseudoalteromonas undina]